jgi:predicted amidohydrolase
MMEPCVAQGVDLFVLTELWLTGLVDVTDESSKGLAESIDGPTVNTLRDFCRTSQVWLLAGTMALKSKAGLNNTSLLINPSGDIVLEYSKIHLFRPMGEDLTYEPGDRLVAAEVNGAGIGVLVCYDLRFPNLARSLAKAGCEVILVPALWPETRINHWETLLRARAIENQVYMVGANGLTSQHGYFIPGHSMIVSPTGESMNSAEMRESAIVRKLDIGRLRQHRSEICYLDDEVEISEVHWPSRVNDPRG